MIAEDDRQSVIAKEMIAGTTQRCSSRSHWLW
jgi:hypothetical protein